MEKPVTTQVQAGCKPLTTFVQTDTNSFREVVQRLTGPTEPNNPTLQASPSNKILGPKKPKLIERRQYMRPKLEIVKPNIHFRSNDQVSPGLNFQKSPSTIMSGLSIKEENNGKKAESMVVNNEEEEKAIKERRFYLHPSPRSKVGYSEPELLALFPLQSPNNNK